MSPARVALVICPRAAPLTRIGRARGASRRYTSIYIVSPMYYGCYSCSYRTCMQCGTCYSRSSCGHEAQHRVAAAQDRYELIAPFNTPSSQSAAWPLTLHIHNFTVFTKSTTPSTGKAFITFTTNAGQEYSELSGFLIGVASLTLFVLACCACCCCRERLWGTPGAMNQLQEVQLYDVPGVVPQELICAACGARNITNSSFCIACGHALPPPPTVVHTYGDGVQVVTCGGVGGVGGVNAAYPVHGCPGAYPGNMNTCMNACAQPVAGGVLPVAQPVMSGNAMGGAPLPMATPIATAVASPPGLVVPTAVPVAQQGQHLKSV